MSQFALKMLGEKCAERFAANAWRRNGMTEQREDKIRRDEVSERMGKFRRTTARRMMTRRGENEIERVAMKIARRGKNRDHGEITRKSATKRCVMRGKAGKLTVGKNTRRRVHFSSERTDIFPDAERTRDREEARETNRNAVSAAICSRSDRAK